MATLGIAFVRIAPLVCHANTVSNSPRIPLIYSTFPILHMNASSGQRTHHLKLPPLDLSPQPWTHSHKLVCYASYQGSSKFLATVTSTAWLSSLGLYDCSASWAASSFQVSDRCTGWGMQQPPRGGRKRYAQGSFLLYCRDKLHKLFSLTAIRRET